MQAGDHGHKGHVGPVRTLPVPCTQIVQILKRDEREIYTIHWLGWLVQIYIVLMHGPCRHTSSIFCLLALRFCVRAYDARSVKVMHRLLWKWDALCAIFPCMQWWPMMRQGLVGNGVMSLAMCLFRLPLLFLRSHHIRMHAVLCMSVGSIGIPSQSICKNVRASSRTRRVSFMHACLCLKRVR